MFFPSSQTRVKYPGSTFSGRFLALDLRQTHAAWPPQARIALKHFKRGQAQARRARLSLLPVTGELGVLACSLPLLSSPPLPSSPHPIQVLAPLVQEPQGRTCSLQFKPMDGPAELLKRAEEEQAA